MRKSLIFANAALLLTAGLLSWQVAKSIRKYSRENDTNAIKITKVEAQSNDILPPLKSPHQYNPPEFALIAEHNIFSETRSSQPAEIAAPVEEIPVLRDRPILTGVILSEKGDFATILESSPSGAPLARKGGRTLRVGDVYREYTVSEISVDQLVLQYGSRREVIPLKDTTKQSKTGAKTNLIATRIVPFGAGSVVAGSITTAMAENARPVSSPSAPVAAAPVAAPGAPQSRGSAPIAPAPAASQSTRGNRNVDVQTNRRVVSTPMGDFVVYPP